MKPPEDLIAPIPQSSDEQMSQETFEYVASCVGGDEINESADSGYFLTGDTVILERTSEVLDGGWAYVGVDIHNISNGVFVKMLESHRAKKSYPFNWDKV